MPRAKMLFLRGIYEYFVLFLRFGFVDSYSPCLTTTNERSASLVASGVNVNKQHVRARCDVFLGTVLQIIFSNHENLWRSNWSFFFLSKTKRTRKTSSIRMTGPKNRSNVSPLGCGQFLAIFGFGWVKCSLEKNCLVKKIQNTHTHSHTHSHTQQKDTILPPFICVPPCQDQIRPCSRFNWVAGSIFPWTSVQNVQPGVKFVSHWLCPRVCIRLVLEMFLLQRILSTRKYNFWKMMNNWNCRRNFLSDPWRNHSRSMN